MVWSTWTQIWWRFQLSFWAFARFHHFRIAQAKILQFWSSHTPHLTEVKLHLRCSSPQELKSKRCSFQYAKKFTFYKSRNFRSKANVFKTIIIPCLKHKCDFIFPSQCNRWFSRSQNTTSYSGSSRRLCSTSLWTSRKQGMYILLCRRMCSVFNRDVEISKLSPLCSWIVFQIDQVVKGFEKKKEYMGALLSHYGE